MTVPTNLGWPARYDWTPASKRLQPFIDQMVRSDVPPAEQRRYDEGAWTLPRVQRVSLDDGDTAPAGPAAPSGPAFGSFAPMIDSPVPDVPVTASPEELSRFSATLLGIGPADLRAAIFGMLAPMGQQQ